MISMRSGWLALGMCLALTAGAWAQALDKLPGDIISAGKLDTAQLGAIESYVDNWCQKLARGGEADVQKARQKLIDPLKQGGSDAFNQAYVNRAASGLAKSGGITSDKAYIRLNTMIVGGGLADAGVLPVAVAGLKDSSPAVRYWAAKALYAAASAEPKPSDEAQKKMLEALLGQIGSERARSVIGQGLLAIGALSIPQAGDALVDILDARLAVHVADPTLTIAPERQAVLQYLSKLGGRTAAVPQFTAETRPAVKRVVRTLYRYMLLSVKTLDANPALDRELAQEYLTMVIHAQGWIDRWAVKKMSAEAVTLKPVDEPIKQGNVKEALWRVSDEWRQTMKKVFDLNDADLALPAAPPTTTSAPAAPAVE